MLSGEDNLSGLKTYLSNHFVVVTGTENQRMEAPVPPEPCRKGKEGSMSVELYAEEIVVAAMGESPSDFKIWLRTERPDDLAGDLRWLCEEYLDYHVIVDVTGLESLGSSCCKTLLNLRDLAAECDFRLVLCGLSPHLKRQLECVHLAREFDTFETREDAIKELSTAFPEMGDMSGSVVQPRSDFF